MIIRILPIKQNQAGLMRMALILVTFYCLYLMSDKRGVYLSF